MDLSTRFDEALAYASFAHRRQKRKKSGIPYLSHLLIVAGEVLDHGGDEDQAIAALLHDAAEDQGGKERLDDIRSRFGQRVATLVDACTDTYEQPKPEWAGRKKRHIARLAKVPEAALPVIAADKLANARTIIEGVRREGAGFLDRFRGGREGTLWFYRAAADAILARGRTALAEELDRTVEELLALSKKAGPAAPARGGARLP